MLVLTRDINQEIEVNGPCKIKVLEVRGKKVKIGIDASDATSIRRAELKSRERMGEAA